MRIKRLLILATCLTLLLPACGKTQDVRGTITSDDTSVSKQESNAKTTSEAASSEESAELSLGHNSNNVYENAFLGIGCKLDEGWTFLTDEQILEQNKLTTNLVGDQYKDALQDASLLTDMIATGSNDMDNITIQLEKLPLSQLSVTTDQYIEASLSSISGPLESMGLQNIVVKKDSTSFLGSSIPCITVSASYQSHACYEIIVPMKRQNYIACIVACTWDENTTAELINSFYEVK